MAGTIIQAADIFRKKAEQLCDRYVHLAGSAEGYLFLKISKRNRKTPDQTIAIDLNRFPTLDVRAGDMVRFRLSSLLTPPLLNFAPSYLVTKIEVLEGRVIKDRAVNFIAVFHEDEHHPFKPHLGRPVRQIS